MSMTTKEITIHFADPELRPKGADAWIEKVGLNAGTLPPMTITVPVNIASEDVEDDDLEEWFTARFTDQGGWLDRVYRYLAENNCAAAMDELAREFDLAPPSHARAVADLLSGNRTPCHAES